MFLEKATKYALHNMEYHTKSSPSLMYNCPCLTFFGGKRFA